MKSIKIIKLFFLIFIIGCQIEPLKLNYVDDFVEGLQLGKTLEKPILINFTGYGLSTNEFMENLVGCSKIQKKLNEEYVTVQLYIDDTRAVSNKSKRGLEELELTNNLLEELKKSVTRGELNLALEKELYNHVNQPLYVIIDSEMEILVKPFGYTSKDRNYFLSKLKKGLKGYKNN